MPMCKTKFQSIVRHYNIVTIESRRLSGEQRITYNATTESKSPAPPPPPPGWQQLGKNLTNIRKFLDPPLHRKISRRRCRVRYTKKHDI